MNTNMEPAVCKNCVGYGDFSICCDCEFNPELIKGAEMNKIDDAVAKLAQTTPVTILWDTYGWYAPYIADDGSVYYESSAEEFDVQFTHEQHKISYETACEWAEQNELGSPIWITSCPVTVSNGTLQLFSHK